jgi:hypothetical protein
VGEENEEITLEDLELELEGVDELVEELNEPKERKIYKGKKNYRGLDYIAGQEPKHATMLKMQVRGCLAWLDGEDKMSYKQMVMLPYADFIDLLRQFAIANKIEGASF